MGAAKESEAQMTWKERAKALWQLLDDIDTADDACRGDDKAFRERARELIKRRNNILSSDGHTLLVPLTPRSRRA